MSDLQWLKELEAELWPEEQQKKGRIETPHGAVQLKLEAKKRLTEEEWDRIRNVVDEEKLIVEMVGTNMFGGVGIVIYEQPCQPGMDHECVLTLTEEHLLGDIGATGGACSREAWGAFSELSDTEQNKAWLKQYGLRQPRPASSFDY